MTDSTPYLYIFMYGSRVYGTHTKTSDKDFILIKEDGEKEQLFYQMLDDVAYENIDDTFTTIRERVTV